MPQSKRHPARRPQQRPARSSHGNPARASAPTTTTAPSRRTLERWSVGPLLLLHNLPRWLVPVVLVLLLVGGLTLPHVIGGVLLLVIAVFVGWLALLSWPAVSTGGRVARLAGVLLVVGAAVARLVGAF